MKWKMKRNPYFYALCLSLLFFLCLSMIAEDSQAITAMSNEETAFVPISSNGGAKNDVAEHFLTIEREELRMIPGGQSIGVQMDTLGVLVVGHHVVDTKKGTRSPGKDANVRVGDVILKLNDNRVENMKEIKQQVEESGEKAEALQVTLKREGKEIETALQPVFDEKEASYKIGLYIRESAAGIGTMTFYDSESKRYGALGHVISDINTRQPIETNGGKIIKSSIISIEKGNRGLPGEKQALFSEDNTQLGNIKKNSEYGIFGELDSIISNGHYDEALPITRPGEVKKGPAKILTVINNEAVEIFDIEITNIELQKDADVKGMIIEIKDEKLLEATGGIVQGMSGSPIIQDGKLVGAVTHVFVNDPTSGYGVHIEWMLNEAGIHFSDQLEKAS